MVQHWPLTGRDDEIGVIAELLSGNEYREIAFLAARGLTSREVAKAGSLSVRTVEGHLYRASCKAGVVGRVELAQVIGQLSDPELPIP
jgi:DNA-binding CsgD family transcriptional regulator